MNLWVLKNNLAYLFALSKVPAHVIRKGGYRIIVVFHRILSEDEALDYGLHPAMHTTLENFRRVLDELSCLGKYVGLETMMEGGDVKETLIAVTFDDGWVDNYTNAMNELYRRNIPATLFITTGNIESGAMHWTEEVTIKFRKRQLRDPEKSGDVLRFFLEMVPGRNRGTIHDFVESIKYIDAEKRRDIIKKFYRQMDCSDESLEGHMLSWEQIVKMKSKGISLGSHTHNHLILKGAEGGEIAEELETSRRLIKTRTGEDAMMFSYPNALYDSTSWRYLRETGFRYGFAIDNRRVPRDISQYYIPRFIVYNDIIKRLQARFMHVPGF